ncbi:MAG: Crp/Fnr family transcriptional regulator [Bacteroidia bacterium]|nr:Crp/Fnr family transcriptional regulator [Bacteroidia bacterium]MCZ2249202.1 Crp/Fnr family transcriptional regulator [Bacteroidia bacterium]
MNSRLSLIRANIEKLIVLSDSEFDTFSKYLVLRNIPKKHKFLSAGEVCNYTGFITSGCLITYTIDENGAEHVIQFAVEDYWIGDLYSFITGSESAYNIEATEDTTVLIIHKNDLEKVYEQIPKFERFFRILVQRSYVALQHRITLNQRGTAQDKYENLLQKIKGIELRSTQKHIASYIGITPESLSRLKRKLHNK